MRIPLSALILVAVATVGNGFGIGWNREVAYEVTAGLVSFAFEGLFLDGPALFSALLVRDRVGTFAAEAIGCYVIMLLAQIMGNAFSYGGGDFYFGFGNGGYGVGDGGYFYEDGSAVGKERLESKS